ncbi:MAG: electron transfer flavoprotein subunit beta/FixA family protein [Sedimentibacter sp.]|uniref:electron transfer flavoprotein subunit beta/FixA family protein n=1 Tax=Sedimentibacter sp. TaxID=1960295 RepID=UPI003158080B
MNILVLVKEVPDMTKVKFDCEKGIVDRSSAESEINPFDMNALQAAVNLKNTWGASVTVLTMGPPKSERSLRDAYARGADRLIMLTDRRFGGADTCATAMTLSSAIKSMGSFDLIICGEKSVDGDTAQVGAEVAEFLDIPHAYYVENITDLNENEITVSVENICGSRQTRKLKLPALIAVTKNINSPQLPTVNRKLKSLEMEAQRMGLDDLSCFISEEDTGFRGSPTKVSKIEVPEPTRRESLIIRDDYQKFCEIMKTEIFKSRR